MTEQLTSLQITKIALQRAYSKLDSSNRALLSGCGFRLDYHNEYWNVIFIAPNQSIWKRLVKRIESITRRFSLVMNTFTVTFCLTSDPIAPSCSHLWRVQRTVRIDQRWWAQIQHGQHPYWVSLTPQELLSLIEIEQPLKRGGRYVIDWEVILHQGGSQYLRTMDDWLLKKCGRRENVFIFTGETVSQPNPSKTLAKCVVEGANVVIQLDIRHLIPAPTDRNDQPDADEKEDELEW